MQGNREKKKNIKNEIFRQNSRKKTVKKNIFFLIFFFSLYDGYLKNRRIIVKMKNRRITLYDGGLYDGFLTKKRRFLTVV